nr:DUF1266 domain-containing protein [uncultured Acetatifactor sp.]
MRKKGVLLSTIILGLALTACGDIRNLNDLKEAIGLTSDSSGGDAAQEESTNAESLPASQEYVSSDGSYQVTLLDGLTQSNLSVLAGSDVMGLDGDSQRKGFGAFCIRSPKSNIPGNPGSMESLEDYADHIANLMTKGSGISTDWKDVATPAIEGALGCLARESVIRQGTSRGQAYGYYLETENTYYSIFMAGNDDDVEDARQILALEILDETSGKGGTRDFLDGMTAVLDTVNGGSIRDAYHMLEEGGADESTLESLASQARETLSSSWGIENTAALMETADSLINGMHNPDALKLLEEYGGLGETDRDAFDAKLTGQNLDQGTYISLLAAYDAWAAYGESAIAAWDLSRVGTIMGFGYASGYCTYEEALDKTLEAALKAKELFGSWEDFNQSYLYGYSYWAEESLTDPESSAGERAELVHDMESQVNGPFALGWDIELTKEW